MAISVTAILAISSLTLLIACHEKQVTGSAHTDGMAHEGALDAASTGQEHLVRSHEELERLRAEGLDGDPSAAARVAIHYAESAIEDPRRLQDASQWVSIAAEMVTSLLWR